ncbi:hypothetical protein KZZ05_21360, partial [Marinobacter adhaerens]|nr:hypothetical protein [Marinobacter adhaerens]
WLTTYHSPRRNQWASGMAWCHRHGAAAALRAGTAKGGVLVALADKFGLPIHAIGVGEQIDDLAPFDPEDFAAALTGLERG